MQTTSDARARYRHRQHRRHRLLQRDPAPALLRPRRLHRSSQLAPGAFGDGSQAAAGGVYNLPGNQGPGGSGAGGSAPTENRPQANANGNRNDANGISIDGISTVSAVWGGASVITPTEDSIDNVRIVTNDYDAENGRFSGAQILVTSKAGTNQLHGSAFIAIHRPGLNAYQPSTGVGKPLRDTQRFNQYGGSLGGPIWKDKRLRLLRLRVFPQRAPPPTANGWYETSAFRAALKRTASPPSTSPIPAAPSAAPSSPRVRPAPSSACAKASTAAPSPARVSTSGLPSTPPSAPRTSPLRSRPDPGVGSGLDGIADVAYYTTTSPFTSYVRRQYNGRIDADVSQKDHLAFAIYWVPSG